jgi:cell wall-associated NlpC family hydrolase
VHEFGSSRRWRLPANAGKITIALGACLCAGQLLVASAGARTTTTSATTTSIASQPAAVPPPTPAVSTSLHLPGWSDRVADPIADRARLGAASRGTHRPVHRRPPAGSRILAEAARLSGRPYVFGAEGPRAFDCSGLTRFVFARLGIALPHKADAQQDYGRSVPRSQARPGDLIFFRNGSYAYHVGIFAGDGYMYDAPHPGKSVGRHKIWSDSYSVRRLIG